MTSPNPVKRRIDALSSLIGDTPMLALHCRLDGREQVVFAKQETLNLTGSIKDRMALAVLREAWAGGQLKGGETIVEATSGNTGIAFAAVGRALGHPVRIYMPDWMSRERVALIASFGAEIIGVSRDEGGFLGSIEKARRFAETMAPAFLPAQFENLANTRAHEETTGPEIYRQLERSGLRPTGFVAGVGTGGTVMGVGAYLRRRVPDLRVHPLEPSSSPTLRFGRKVGQHRIQGISDEFVPALVDLSRLDAIVDVDDGDAIRMAQRLARELGLGVGISSGANLLGSLLVGREQGPDAVVVTVFPDSNKKYLSTDLFAAEPPRPDHLSSRVELLDFEVLPRAGTS